MDNIILGVVIGGLAALASAYLYREPTKRAALAAWIKGLFVKKPPPGDAP